jgi:hypothetical protein
MASPAGGAGTAAPHPDLRQGDGPPSRAGRAHRPARLLRPCAVAARLQREHLLRQYLPKGTDLSVFSQLDAIATRLNRRKTLGFATPDEVFAALVDKAANAVTAPNAEGVRYGT